MSERAGDDGFTEVLRLLAHARVDDAERLLLAIPTTDARHRAACVLLARTSVFRGEVPFRVDHHLQAFLQTPPRNDDERLAIQSLIPLYDAQGLDDFAAELRARLDDDGAAAAPRASAHGLPSLPPLPAPSNLTLGASTATPDVVDDEEATGAHFRTEVHLPSGADIGQHIDGHGRKEDASDDVETNIEVDVAMTFSPTANIDEARLVEGRFGEENASDDDAPRSNVWATSKLPPIEIASRPDPGPTTPDGNVIPHRTNAPGSSRAAARDAAQTPPRVTPGAAPSKPKSSTNDAKRSRFQIGAVINDRYEIVELVGKGGMATVFRVVDRELDEDVALKLFHRTNDEDQAEVQRFKRELKLARRLQHPNIVQVFDLGVADDAYFITMELLDGEDLHRVIRRYGAPLPLNSAALLIVAACRGLAVAHGIHVVHRDIKPANLFLTRDTVLKIMDFGIAKGSVDASSAATKTGMMMGTPQYMAPEQAQDAARVGPASDLYALGVILFEMLSGRRPFDGQNAMAIIVDAVTKPAPSLATFRPDLPVAVVDIVTQLLEKDPHRRPASADVLADMLAPFTGQ